MDIGFSKLLTYGLRVAAVLAFWYLARRRLFAAAVIQSLGYATYGVLIIPVIRSVFALQMGYVLGAVLLVEAVRQGLHRQLRDRSRGAIFVRLVLALFLVSILSYVVRGAAEYTRPAAMLMERLCSEVLPCCPRRSSFADPGASASGPPPSSPPGICWRVSLPWRGASARATFDSCRSLGITWVRERA